jgi:8-oxo-dGTP pyrophosphatase MutT (NUDIX family)
MVRPAPCEQRNVSSDSSGELSDADLPSRLAQRLMRPLAGRAARARYQPELSYGRHFGPAPANARPAAVLLLLYPKAGTWHLPLTLRPAHLLAHAGQISLPGGTVEPLERSEDAALRELSEELGVGPQGIKVLGQLSTLYLYRSNYLIEPWLAATDCAPDWQPNMAEVAELLEVPLAALGAPSSTQIEQRQDRGIVFRAPAFRWQQHSIWGATAMILAELVALVDELHCRSPG